MEGKVHAGISVSGAILLFLVFRSWCLSLCFVISGVLLDIDHLLDYYLIQRQRGDLKTFATWCMENRWSWITLLFHGWEFLLLLMIAAWTLGHPCLWGLALGQAVHMGLDQWHNGRKYRLHPLFYSFLFRVSRGFRKSGLFLDPSGQDPEDTPRG